MMSLNFRAYWMCLSSPLPWGCRWIMMSSNRKKFEPVSQNILPAAALIQLNRSWNRKYFLGVAKPFRAVSQQVLETIRDVSQNEPGYSAARAQHE